MEKKVWFIIGTSSGFGKVWTKAAIQRGDQVVATVRSEEDKRKLEEELPKNLKVEILDVQNKEACLEVTKRAFSHYGRIDVFINNAGYGQFGFIEEVCEVDIRNQFETNIFGNIWMLQAVLPYFRKQGNGHILQLSSIGGLMSFPGVGYYHATKYAMEGICDSLAQEVAELGIKVTLIEPAGFTTDFGSRSAKTAESFSCYDSVREARKKQSASNPAGSPEATCSVLFKLVDHPNPPLRLLFGKNAFERVEAEYQKRLFEWKNWYEESREAHGE